MNPKNTWLLVFVTASLFAFIFFFERHLHKPIVIPPRVLPNFVAAEISGVQIELAGQLEIRVQHTNAGWQLTKPLVWPAQPGAVESLLQALADLPPRTRIPAQVLKDRRTIDEEYGFLNPQVTLIFQQGQDSRELKLGNLTAPGDQIYAQVIGQDHVDIIDAEFFKKFIPHNANDWRDTTFLNLTNQPFDRIAVAYGAQAALEVSREKTNQFWRMNKPVSTRADDPKIENLLLKLQSLLITNFVTDDPRADLESYGLQPPALEVQFDAGTNVVLTAQFGKSPTNATNLIYARCNGQTAIVLVARESVAPWLAGFQAFRDRHLVRFARGLPDVIEVSGQTNFTVEHQANGLWLVTQPYVFPADTNVMRSLLSNLTDLQAASSNNEVAVKDVVLPETDFPRYGLDKPSRRYLLKRNVPAGASNGVIAQLDFGLVTNGEIYVRRADLPDETSVYAVTQENFAKIPADALQLRDRHIWNFSEDQVGSIIIRQNGKEQRLLHLSSGHWKIAAGSQGLVKDELQLEVAAQELGTLTAQNWIERGDADRAQYGFTDNSSRVSVEVKTGNKSQAMALDIGGSSPGGLRYGDVRMDDGQNWIFEFPADIWDSLAFYLNLQENRSP